MAARSLFIGMVLVATGFMSAAQAVRADDTTKVSPKIKAYSATDYAKDRLALKKYKTEAAKLDTTHKYLEAARAKAQAQNLKRKMDLARIRSHKSNIYSSSPYSTSPYHAPYSTNP